MLTIKTIASSSKGNCYLVQGATSSLLLEAGLPIKKIKKALNYKLHKVSACLVTHEHMDHAKAVKDLLKMGVEVVVSKGTSEALELSGPWQRITEPLVDFRKGEFIIKAFEVQHDAAEPFGYLIHSTETGDTLLFVTDTYYLKYKFPDLNYIMIECNYATDILKANIEAGKISRSMKHRLMKSHFSLENVLKYLGELDLTHVKEIHLLHLSDGNSNANRMKSEIEALTWKYNQVFVADK